MAVNVQFSIAVHLLAALACFGADGAPSARLARSVNTSPSFVRRTLAKLSKAGLLETTTGKGGTCRLARDARRISLLEVYRAVDAPKAFAIHHYREQRSCVVSCHIKGALEGSLTRAQGALEKRLARISLAQLVAEMKKS